VNTDLLAIMAAIIFAARCPRVSLTEATADAKALLEGIEDDARRAQERARRAG
jgi:hypothetical protein